VNSSVFNKVVLVGRIVKDAELHTTNNDKKVCGIRLAVQRDAENSDFVNVVTWEKIAEFMANNGHKGRLILVEGRLQIRQYEKDGVRREVAEVVANNVRFLDRPKSDKADAGDKKAAENNDDIDLSNLPF
jgi:single-strand DNA-binding protein